eukprot:6709701-Pyramimonas_sp.AAC.1
MPPAGLPISAATLMVWPASLDQHPRPPLVRLRRTLHSANHYATLAIARNVCHPHPKSQLLLVRDQGIVPHVRSPSWWTLPRVLIQ